MDQLNRFSGAWTALLSPQTASGDVDVPALRKFTEYLIDEIEIDGLYLCGSTGEGIYMTEAGRKIVSEVVVEQTAGRVPIIVHIGCQSSKDAVELASHAEQLNVDGISSIIPAGYSNIQAAKHYFSQLANAAPSMPLLPYLIGLSVSPVPLMEELLDIPNVAGTKYTAPNMYEMEQLIRFGERGERPFGWTVFSGMDEQCVLGSLYGAHGNIGSTLNFIPGAYKAIHKLLADGEIAQARDLQMKVNRVTEAAISVGFMGALFEMVRMLGYDCGDPRVPNLPLTEAKRDELHQKLDALNWTELTGKVV